MTRKHHDFDTTDRRALAPRRLLGAGTALAAALAATSAHAQTTLFTFDGSKALGGFGSSVGLVGDVDLDGVPDVAIGDPFDDTIGLDAGALHIYSAASGNPLVTLFANSANDGFGVAVVAVGNLNIDGRPELLIGAENDSGTGSARLVDGSSGVEIAHWLGATIGAKFGTALAAVGDVDGDGTPDFAIGGWAEDPNGPDSGLVRLYSGASLAPIFTLQGAAAGDRFGSAIAGLGDVNGDTHADVAVGAPGTDSVLVISGQDGSTLYTVTGAAGEEFGSALAGLADVTGDGFGDLAIGAPQPGLGTGYVHVASGADGAQHVVISGQANGDGFGSALAAPGDVDGDGLDDLVVGAPDAAVERGYVRIHSASTGQVFYSSTGSQTAARHGQSVAGAGDVNGDGFMDVLVGSVGDAGLVPASGTAGLILSSCPVPRIYCTAGSDGLGCTSRVEFEGAPSLSVGDNFRLWARDVRSGSVGVLGWGLAGASQPVGGQTLCVSSTTLILTPLFSGGATPGQTDCTGAFTTPFGNQALLQMGWAPGTEIFTQFWYRDSDVPSGIALTDGLKFTVCP